MNKLLSIVFGLIVAPLSGLALAQSNLESMVGVGNKLTLQLSPYTKHLHEDTAHKNVVLVGVEREHPNGKIDGLSLFSNSFGQESAYLYPWGGAYKSILGVQPLSFKWTAGVLYGYKPPYENKVPLNYKGFSPGVIFAFAYELKPGWSAQVNILGTAAVMFQLNAPLN
jgi:hypothetical protein